MKTKIQFAINVLGIAAMVYGIAKMSETTTMILPSWFVIALVATVCCGVCIGLGFVVKHLLKSDWHPITFGSIFVMIFVGIYSIMEYKPVLKIVVPGSYTGEVKLIVSNSPVENHEIRINNYGIGYITRKDFDDGFYPKIIKGVVDITGEVKEYSKGALATEPTDRYSLRYFSFQLPGESNKVENDIDALVRIGAVDTMRLPVK